MVLAFEYLHGKHMLFRDLKPENVLVSPDGFLKLADFGFIKHLLPHERTYTFCGTPEYIAPEIILNKGYSHAVDWWAFGIFLYELLVGRPPFMSNDTYEIFEMTLKKKILFPKEFDSGAKSLIKHLCKADLAERFGNLHKGAADIKNHRFFKTFNWDKLVEKKVLPPHIPSPPESSTKAANLTKHADLVEANDNKDFPPVKVEKDPFLAWF